LPPDAITIFFESRNLSHLIEFLEMLPVKREGLRNAIVGRKGDKYEIVSFDKIMYFEAEGNDVYCCTQNEKLTVKNKLYELESSLFDKGFIRISKSIIVNILAIKEVIPWFDSRFILKLQNNTKLEVSKKFSKNFKEFLFL
jgi:DNA-binding LytR/AlgR family response regulator